MTHAGKIQQTPDLCGLNSASLGSYCKPRKDVDIIHSTAHEETKAQACYA